MKLMISLAVLLMASVSASAQTARQGDQSADPTEFHSPMVLEAPFAVANPSTWTLKKGSSVMSPDLGQLRRFHCDGVSIGMGALHPKEISGDRVETQMDFSIVNPGHDKFVKVLFELFNGDTKVAETATAPIKAKEGAFVQTKATIVARKADLVADPLTKIRITMTAWDY